MSSGLFGVWLASRLEVWYVVGPSFCSCFFPVGSCHPTGSVAQGVLVLTLYFNFRLSYLKVCRDKVATKAAVCRMSPRLFFSSEGCRFSLGWEFCLGLGAMQQSAVALPAQRAQTVYSSPTYCFCWLSHQLLLSRAGHAASQPARAYRARKNYPCCGGKGFPGGHWDLQGFSLAEILKGTDPHLTTSMIWFPFF